jgi:predicted regulator of Ras-like GTPase activity (Roadblock/LC7/MglB family)
MSDFAVPGSASRLDKVLHDLLRRAPELQAAAVVSFDGLPMASALPYGFDEDRVAAMSAALLSLGERASQGLGRGSLNQVYIEGEEGTVFLVSADDEAVLVAVGAHGAKVGLLLFEVRRGAQAVAETLRQEDPPEVAGYVGHDVSPLPVHVAGHAPEPEPAYAAPAVVPVAAVDEVHAAYPAPAAHTPSYSNLPEAPAYPTYDGPAPDDDLDHDALDEHELVPVAELVPVDAYVAEEPDYEAGESLDGAPTPSSHLGSWASFTPGGSLSAANGQGLDPWL